MLLCEPYSLRWIQGRGPHGIPQAPIGELSNIADGPIHGQRAPRQFSVYRALAILDIYLNRAQPIASVGHAGCRDGIGDQHGAFHSFRLEK